MNTKRKTKSADLSPQQKAWVTRRRLARQAARGSRRTAKKSS